jgi:hypothetical protein
MTASIFLYFTTVHYANKENAAMITEFIVCTVGMFPDEKHLNRNPVPSTKLTRLH